MSFGNWWVENSQDRRSSIFEIISIYFFPTFRKIKIREIQKRPKRTILNEEKLQEMSVGKYPLVEKHAMHMQMELAGTQKILRQHFTKIFSL